MNFEYIPELKHHYAYFILWGIMVPVITITMLLYFKRKKWLKRKKISNFRFSGSILLKNNYKKKSQNHLACPCESKENPPGLWRAIGPPSGKLIFPKLISRISEHYLVMPSNNCFACSGVKNRPSFSLQPWASPA
ncbi:MAG: hypothetical protein V8R91_03190 [Butyricimonas faecihominis]